jgi:hypothetical protein
MSKIKKVNLEDLLSEKLLKDQSMPNDQGSQPTPESSEFSKSSDLGSNDLSSVTDTTDKILNEKNETLPMIADQLDAVALSLVAIKSVIEFLTQRVAAIEEKLNMQAPENSENNEVNEGNVAPKQ